MSINKKSSRKIIVNQINYVWKIKKIKELCPCCYDETLNIMIEKVNSNKPLLIKIFNPFPDKSSITPSIIKNIIIFSLKNGWTPESNKIFSLDLKDFNDLFLKIQAI